MSSQKYPPHYPPVIHANHIQITFLLSEIQQDNAEYVLSLVTQYLFPQKVIIDAYIMAYRYRNTEVLKVLETYFWDLLASYKSALQDQYGFFQASTAFLQPHSYSVPPSQAYQEPLSHREKTKKLRQRANYIRGPNPGPGVSLTDQRSMPASPSHLSELTPTGIGDEKVAYQMTLAAPEQILSLFDETHNNNVSAIENLVTHYIFSPDTIYHAYIIATFNHKTIVKVFENYFVNLLASYKVASQGSHKIHNAFQEFLSLWDSMHESEPKVRVVDDTEAVPSIVPTTPELPSITDAQVAEPTEVFTSTQPTEIQPQATHSPAAASEPEIVSEFSSPAILPSPELFGSIASGEDLSKPISLDMASLVSANDELASIESRSSGPTKVKKQIIQKWIERWHRTFDSVLDEQRLVATALSGSLVISSDQRDQLKICKEIDEAIKRRLGEIKEDINKQSDKIPSQPKNTKAEGKKTAVIRSPEQKKSPVTSCDSPEKEEELSVDLREIIEEIIGFDHVLQIKKNEADEIYEKMKELVENGHVDVLEVDSLYKRWEETLYHIIDTSNNMLRKGLDFLLAQKYLKTPERLADTIQSYKERIMSVYSELMNQLLPLEKEDFIQTYKRLSLALFKDIKLIALIQEMFPLTSFAQETEEDYFFLSLIKYFNKLEHLKSGDPVLDLTVPLLPLDAKGDSSPSVKISLELDVDKNCKVFETSLGKECLYSQLQTLRAKTLLTERDKLVGTESRYLELWDDYEKLSVHILQHNSSLITRFCMVVNLFSRKAKNLTSEIYASIAESMLASYEIYENIMSHYSTRASHDKLIIHQRIKERVTDFIELMSEVRGNFTIDISETREVGARSLSFLTHFESFQQACQSLTAGHPSELQPGILAMPGSFFQPTARAPSAPMLSSPSRELVDDDTLGLSSTN